MCEPKLVKYQVPLICLVLAMTTLVAFEQVGYHDFVSYDDRQYVIDNPSVNQGLSGESIAWAFTSGHASNWHPLTWLSHMADCELYGLKPAGHHITSLLLHILNTLLLFCVFKKMTGSVWPSAFVATVFSLHPLHVESVAWVAERKDVLSTLFWLLTMIAYVRYAEHSSRGNYLLVALLFGLGLMAKPMLVTLPFVLLLLDYWPLKRFYTFSTRRLIVEKIPLFVLAAGSSVITFLVQQEGGAVTQAEIASRLGNALVSYVGYIGKMIYPSGLAVLYPYPAEGVGWWHPLVSMALLAGLTLFFIRLAGKQRYALVGWLWYLITLVPVIGIVQVGSQAMADRYTYIPSIGISVAVAWGLGDLLSRWKYKRVVLSISAIIAILLATLATRIQVSHWKNSMTLYEHTLNVTERNSIIHGNYGEVLHEEGRTAEAIVQYQKVLKIRSDKADAHYNLGVLLWETGKQTQSIAHYQKALQLEPDMTKAIYNLATAFMKTSKHEEAVGHFQKVLELQPGNAVAHYNLAVVLEKLGKAQQAIDHFKQTLKLNPRNADAHYNLGVMLGKMGNFEQTIEHFDKTLQLNPENFETHNKLAKVYHELKNPGKTVVHLSQSLALQPQQPPILNMVAWLRAAHPQADFHDPAEAVGLARHSCELTGFKNPDYLDTLGVAYAAAGQFSEAIEITEKAIAESQSKNRANLLDTLKNRLMLYRKNQPISNPR